MDGYQRRLCSNCGEGLGFSESDPCEACQPFNVRLTLRVGGEVVQPPVDEDDVVYFDGGPDIVPLQPWEQVNR